MTEQQKLLLTEWTARVIIQVSVEHYHCLDALQFHRGDTPRKLVQLTCT